MSLARLAPREGHVPDGMPSPVKVSISTLVLVGAKEIIRLGKLYDESVGLQVVITSAMDKAAAEAERSSLFSLALRPPAPARRNSVFFDGCGSCRDSCVGYTDVRAWEFVAFYTVQAHQFSLYENEA